jgi:hypothetical protein
MIVQLVLLASFDKLLDFGNVMFFNIFLIFFNDIES